MGKLVTQSLIKAHSYIILTSTSTRVMQGGTGEDNSEEDGPLPNNGPQLSECTFELPAFVQVFATRFLWGTLDGVTLAKAVDEACAEAVHWRRNIFMVPSGKTDKNYVKEETRLLSAYADESPLEQIALKAAVLMPQLQTRLLSAYADESPLEQIALKAAMLMPQLFLQKPHPTSKTKDHVRCL